MINHSITQINNHIIADKIFANHDTIPELYHDMTNLQFCRYVNAIVNYNTRIILKSKAVYTILTNALVASDIDILNAKHGRMFTELIFTPILAKQVLRLRYAGKHDLVYSIYKNHKLIQHQVLKIHERGVDINE